MAIAVRMMCTPQELICCCFCFVFFFWGGGGGFELASRKNIVSIGEIIEPLQLTEEVESFIKRKGKKKGRAKSNI